MKVEITIEEYGLVTYEESFWSGNKKISINNTELTKVSKNLFQYTTEETVIDILVKGNMLTGSTLYLNGREYTVVPKIKWYEAVIAIIIFFLDLIWGNNPTLCAIFPIVGGAIGGIVCAVAAYFSIIVMKMTSKAWQKILIGLGFLLGTFLICHIIALSLLLGA